MTRSPNLGFESKERTQTRSIPEDVSDPCHMVRNMRAAYIDAHVDLLESFRRALAWAGRDSRVTIVGPSSSTIDASPFLKRSGLPIGVTSNKHSRFSARPAAGTVIAWCLYLNEILALQGRADLDGVVVVRALQSHAPWITAHHAEALGEHPVATVGEATPPMKAMVAGISMLPVLNHGLSDSRERSTAVEALTFMHVRGHKLDPQQLIVEAQRQGWPGDSPQQLADLAKRINSGKQLRFQNRLNPDAMAEWDRT